MKYKSWHINRRELLKGGGVALALPLLDGMGKAMEVASKIAPTAMPPAFPAMLPAASLFVKITPDSKAPV